MYLKTNETYILSYIKGTLSDLEMRECDALMVSSAEFSKQVNEIKNAYNLLENLEAQKKIDAEAAWKKIERKIKRDKTKTVVWNFTRNAAAILLPLFLMFQYVVQPLLKDAPQQELITLYSAPGIVTKTILPDGSQVWLNSQSEITYPREFDYDRTVKLVGEAYFDVKSDIENRFNVITPDNSIVSAFGTEFNVNAYSEDTEYIVTLAKGNVDVTLENQTDHQTLKPGQKAVINSETHSLYTAGTDTYVDTAWKDGKMVFRRESIATIATKLSRKFGVTIEVKGNITGDYQFTATFTTETLEDILELLKLSASIDYSIAKQEKLSDNSFSQRVVTIVCK